MYQALLVASCTTSSVDRCRTIESSLKIINQIVTFDRITVRRYHLPVIRSFADKETEKIFKRYFSRKLPPEIQHAARLKLEILDAAEVLQDLRIPLSNRLEKLSGD